MTHSIEVHSMAVQYHNTTAIDNVSIQLPAHVRAAVVGPNGAGKSTFIKALLDLVPCQSQGIKLLGNSLENVRQNIAYVPQTAMVNWHFPTTVFDVVLMGITSQRSGFRLISKKDKERAVHALKIMELYHLRKRQINQLSGGQKQRVFIARAIAQQAELYLLDEPLAGVDMTSEELIMNQLKTFQSQGKTSLTVHHDLNTVAKYFDYVIFLNKTIIAHGYVKDVFTPANIDRTYHEKRGESDD